AGLSKSCELDTEQMSAEDAATLRSLVEQSRLETIATPESVGKIRDACNYVITIEGDGESRRVAANDHSLPESGRALVRFLQKHATVQPR
ncbi:MAG TPA: protealysin inhibitor emfourin, partial [Gemmataceae bacterium]|nr:protealysin inhibitor emfourin [Gemmataceae bacterium]